MATQATHQMKHNTKYLPFCGLRHHFLLGINLVLAFVLAAFSGATYANVNSVVSTPSSISVPARGATTIDVVWKISRTEVGGGGTRIVSSSAAVLQIGGSTVANFAGTISTTSTLANLQTETLTLNEALTFNAALARRIASSSAGSVQITRVFSDTQRVATGTMRVSTGSGNSGPLSVNRIDLAFENKARTDVVYKDEAIHAIADLSFRSSGILKGEWRIVDPTASAGRTGGRILRVIRQNLVSPGEGQAIIVSPQLPTNENGLYLVSFVVENVSSVFETPILRYFVLNNENALLTSAPSMITVRSPANGADLHASTVFVWQGMKGAKAYQVELFNKESNIPLTGKLVSATTLKLSLSDMSLGWLESGYEYKWRIRAFDADGKVIGQSELRMLNMP